MSDWADEIDDSLPPRGPAGPSELEQALTAVNPDSLTPREALDTLYQLKKLLP
jgi:DNA mismatch repair protein MutS